MFQKRLRALIRARPVSEQFHTFHGAELARIKAKATLFIRTNPRPRAEFYALTIR